MEHSLNNETPREYVVRKLKEPIFNHSAISLKTNVSRDTLVRIETNITKNPSSRTIEVLYRFFKEASK